MGHWAPGEIEFLGVKGAERKSRVSLKTAHPFTTSARAPPPLAPQTPNIPSA